MIDLFIINILSISIALLLVRQLFFWYHTLIVNPSDIPPTDQSELQPEELNDNQQLIITQ